jgi:hypothetical protein
MRLTGRRLPTFLNSNFFVPRRMFSASSGLIDRERLVAERADVVA